VSAAAPPAVFRSNVFQFGLNAENGSNRVNRGGGWNNNARNCRSANRNRNAPDNMATDRATIIDSDLRETAGIKDQAVMEVEYPVQLAYTREPVMCLAGTISVIRPGRRDLALSDEEWQDLELPELPESHELPELSEPVGSGDVADGK
jgi:hypothetical protein